MARPSDLLKESDSHQLPCYRPRRLPRSSRAFLSRFVWCQKDSRNHCWDTMKLNYAASNPTARWHQKDVSLPRIRISFLKYRICQRTSPCGSSYQSGSNPQIRPGWAKQRLLQLIPLLVLLGHSNEHFIDHYGDTFIIKLLQVCFTDLLPHKDSILKDWKTTKTYMLSIYYLNGFPKWIQVRFFSPHPPLLSNRHFQLQIFVQLSILFYSPFSRVSLFFFRTLIFVHLVVDPAFVFALLQGDHLFSALGSKKKLNKVPCLDIEKRQKQNHIKIINPTWHDHNYETIYFKRVFNDQWRKKKFSWDLD